MNNKLLIFLLFLTAKTICFAQSFTLNVLNGFGSGTYNEGDTIHVWSENTYNDTVFTNWSGTGASYLNFENEWHTTVIVPQGTGLNTIDLIANYDVIPQSTLLDSMSVQLFGINAGVLSNVVKTVWYGIPPSPKAIVYLFHGTDGNSKNFFNQYEAYKLLKDLIYDGFAVFAFDANEVTMGDQNGNGYLRWDVSNANIADSSNNVDILNTAVLRDTIINLLSLPINTPTYTLGMSAGANFSDLCSSALGFNASAHITAKGQFGTYLRQDISPVIWIMSENDNNASADNAIAYNHYITMDSIQVAEYHLLLRSPLNPDRFLRSQNGILPIQADSIFERLFNNGYLDLNNFLSVLDISVIDSNLFLGLGLSNIQIRDVYNQLSCVNADHVLHSDFDKNIIRFFNQQFYPLVIDNMMENHKAVRIFPNPTNGFFSIVFNSSQENTTLNIMDVSGKLIDTMNYSQVDLIEYELNQPEGIYLIEVSDGENQRSLIRLIKQ